MKILHSVLFAHYEPKKHIFIEEKFFPTQQEAIAFLNAEKPNKIGWEHTLTARSTEDDRAIDLLAEGRSRQEALELFARAESNWGNTLAIFANGGKINSL